MTRALNVLVLAIMVLAAPVGLLVTLVTNPYVSAAPHEESSLVEVNKEWAEIDDLTGAKKHQKYARPSLREADYQAVWCKAAGGVTEYVLDDKARVDCLTDDFAVEFDFDKKWAESIGQALYYGMETGRVPGVVIILGDEDDPSVRRHKARVEKLAERYAVALFYMRRADSIEALRAVYEGFVEFDHMIHQAYERLMLRKRTGDKIYWGEPE